MNSDRLRIDPGGRYPSDGLRLVERNAEKVLDLLPDAVVERTRDCIQIESRERGGIVVLVTAEAIEFRLPSVEWTMGSYGPAIASRLWTRVEASVSDAALADLLAMAMSAREAEFVTCRYCGRRVGPEHRHGDVCHSCAEKHLGVVH